MPGVTEVVEKLASARLVTLSDGRAEVAHEALFREWPRLRSWLADDAAGRELVRRLSLDAQEWGASGRDDTVLWRGTRLLAATDALHARGDEVTALEREFLALSQAAAEAEQHAVEQRAAVAGLQNTRLRRLLAVLALVLVVALVAGGWPGGRSARPTSREHRRTRSGSRPWRSTRTTWTWRCCRPSRRCGRSAVPRPPELC